MNRPLLDFNRPVTAADGIPNIVRGVISAALSALLIYLLSYSLNVARQYDKDGEIRTGIVERVTSTTHRKRRGRVSVSYNAAVKGPHGTEVVPLDTLVEPGSLLRYAYSPTLDGTIEAPSPVKPGGFVWLEIRSAQFIIVSIALLLSLFYSYNQFRLVYIVSSGRYSVNGRPPADFAGG